MEALRRANSTYVPGTVEPMLPHSLSSGACSLSPGVERLAVTAEIELDRAARPTRTRFYRSRIRSDARLDYDQLDRVFDGREEAPAAAAEPLAAARDVAAALGEHRGTTSLDVESAEPEFEFDAEGNVVAAHRVPQTEAHRLIERLMILTNERVAEFLVDRRVPAVYRVHAQPDPPRIERLLEQLGALGRADPAARPGALAALGGRDGGGGEPARPARGRAARARPRRIYLPCAPIAETGRLQRDRTPATPGSARTPTRTSPRRSGATPTCSCTGRCWRRWGRGRRRRRWARRARSPPTAPRRSASRRRSSAMPTTSAPHTCWNGSSGSAGSDAEFDGEVSGVIRAGAFVAFGGELGDVYEGMLPARTLPGGRYELDRDEVSLIGSGEGATALRLGDPVRVRVTGVESGRGRVDLELTGGGGKGPPERAADGEEGEKTRPGLGRRRHQPPGAAQIRVRRDDGGGDRPDRLRGEGLRSGQAQMTDSYAVVNDGEVWLRNLHIPPYEFSDVDAHTPERPRKLLLHRDEIERLIGKTAEKGLTLVPVRIYFKGPRAKVELALARGKEGRDRRREIADRDVRREVEREFKGRMR